MNLPSDILALVIELDALRSQRDDHWQIPQAEGELLYQIAATSGARTIVEAGTSYGFSGLFWGAALRPRGGVLHTIDMDPRKVESSRETFGRAGLGEIVKNHVGDARQTLATFSGPIDIVFLDAGDKSRTRELFDAIWHAVRPGGSVITDNAVTHRTELAPFVQYVRGLPNSTSAEVPVGNGFEWTVKLGQSTGPSSR